MCGRFYISVSDEELRDIAKAAAANALPDETTLKISGEIFPTDTVRFKPRLKLCCQCNGVSRSMVTSGLSSMRGRKR